MTRPRSHRSFGRSGGPRRLTQWIGPADQNFVSVASGGGTLVAFGPLTEQTTIVRTRGMVTVRPAAVTVDLTVCGAFGVGIVSDEARVAGIASIPEPFSDADWGGWLVWRSFTYRFEFGTAVGIDFPNWSFEVDSKAMRKVSPNESFVFVAESQSGAYQISAPLRTLVKLS